MLAALLLWQSGLAAAHCLGRAAAFAIEVCTLAGPQQVASSDGAGPAQATTHADFCAACHALPALSAPEPADPISRIAWIIHPDPAPHQPPAPSPRARGPPCCPRAPPILA